MLPLGQYVAILSTKADFNLKPTQYIYRTTGPTELLNSWKNIQYDGVNFRFYRQPVDNLFVNTGFFYFNISKKGLAGVATDNDIHLFVQPDVSSVFTMRTNDGNAVKVYKNGFIQLVTDMPRTAAYKQTSPSRERFRIITPDVRDNICYFLKTIFIYACMQGKIVRHTLGGETEVYWPSGSVFQYAQDQKSWTLVKEDGHRIQLDDKRSVNPLSPVTVGLENYPLERRSVLVREDLVSIDKNVEENFVRVQQRDNSVFEYTNESELRQFKIKSQQWFPDISVDRINCTVTLKWSQGYKLTVDRKKTGMQSVALNLVCMNMFHIFE
jgi:hypothetical protein